MIGLKLNPKRKVDFKVGSKGKVEFKLKEIMVPPGRKVSLKKDYDPDFTGGYKDKEGAVEQLALNVERLADLQEKLYAQDTYALLVIFQARDAAGKDGAIKHVLSGVNPQGCHVTSFKAPSAEELDHDYLWRAARALPARGMIGIFNRSYYEEVLVVRVHPDLLEKQRLPGRTGGDDFWKRRFEEMNNFEKYLVDNGIVVLKFFLNVSKEEQRQRFLARIDESGKELEILHSRLPRTGPLERLSGCLPGNAQPYKQAVGPVVCNPGRSQVVRKAGNLADHLCRARGARPQVSRNN